jgi:adenosine 3'-phospho 5'-phosphosulfate transporter B2
MHAFPTQTAGKMSEVMPIAPVWSYAVVSVSNVIATFCQYEALKHVSFPVQTLGKCAKMIPVMVWGIIIMQKRYGLKDFGVACVITLGCTLFLLTGEVTSKASKHSSAMESRCTVCKACMLARTHA